ncbi:peptidase dimerization domain-containing protein [Amygdalobacter nucleatus]|uniref:peptidase dimerization domain-containing protein n=1 Tax=Amygdalobacter nucleatus TaxID=3029274 RepID=UPI0036F32C45
MGLHIQGNIDCGKAALQVGPILASADTFDIYVRGKNGHGASPQLAIDPIVAGAEVVQALQALVSIGKYVV